MILQNHLMIHKGDSRRPRVFHLDGSVEMVRDPKAELLTRMTHKVVDIRTGRMIRGVYDLMSWTASDVDAG